MCSQEQLARIRLDIQYKTCAPWSNRKFRYKICCNIRWVLQQSILRIDHGFLYTGESSNSTSSLTHAKQTSIPSLYFSLYPNCGRDRYTGCLLKIVVFFRKFQNIFRTLASLGFSSVCTPDFMLGPLNGRQKTSAAAELAELRKITTF